MKKSRLAVAVLIGMVAIALSSCSSSSSSTNGQPSPNSESKDLQVGNIGLIPTNTDALGGTYPLMLFNNTSEVMVVDSVTASGVADSIRKQIGKDDSKLFDADMCKQIQPHGSCSIQMKSASLTTDSGIGANGQYGINVKSHLKLSNKSYNEDQVIGYQNFNISASNGVYYNTSTATVTNILDASDNMGITIPVFFKQAYSKVKVNSGILGATLVGCGLPDKDGTYNIAANSTCALTTVFSGGKQFSNTITLTDNYTAAVTKSQSKTGSLKSGNNQIMTVSVVNNLNPQALMTTAVVTGFIPTDNTTPVTVTFVNVGTYQAAITSMGFSTGGSLISFGNGTPVTINGSTTATVSNDTCSNQTIQAGSSCQVTFTMNGSVNSGSMNVQMNYTTGLGTGTGSTFYNIYYYAPTSNVVLTSTVSGDLTNTFLYQTKTATVTVANASTTNTSVNLNNSGVPQLVAVGNPPKPNNISVTANNCNQNGAILAAGNSCAYTVSYTSPTTDTNGIINNLRGVITGTYTNIGQTITVGSTSSLPYSANANSNFVSLNPDPLQMVVPAGQSVSQVVTITNQTSGSSINGISFNLTGLTGVTLPSGSNSCSSANLSYLQSCQVTFVFAPNTQESLVVGIPVSFNVNGNPAEDILTANFQGSTSAVNVVLSGITASQPGLPVGAPAYTGDGESQNSAFSFYNYGNSLQITLTYTNIGTESAVNIQMMGDTFPTQAAGYSIQDNCSGQALLQNQSCSVVATTINPTLATTLTSSSNLNFVIPSMVYTDVTESVPYVKNMFTTPTGNSSNIWVTVSPSVVPNVNVGTGSIVALNGSSYYLYPVTFSNNANGAQGVAINYSAPMPSAASPYGFGSTMTAVPSTGAASLNLAGGQSTTQYLWFPTTATPSSSSLLYSVSYSGSYPNFYSSFIPNPMIGVTYTASGNNITGSWSSLQSFSNSSFNFNATAGSSGNISQLLQNQGYLYALNGNVYSMPITGWNTNTSGGSTYSPESTSTGALGSVTAQTTGYTPSYLAINTTSGTTYAAVVESASTNLHVYTVSAGTFSNPSTSQLTNLSSNIGAAAIGSSGNLYVTSESNLYLCGTITAIAACNRVTSLPAFPSATTAVNGLTVTTSNGYVFVAPNVAAGTGGIVPVTTAYYALDNGSTSTSFSGLTNSNYSSASVASINYNLVYGVLNPFVGYYGTYTYYSNPNYSTSPQFQFWSSTNFNSGTSSSYISNANAFAFYSFMPVENNGVIYY